ncbi:MAG: FKBP-type peptidyl-prolyl cis-trans isomerase [Pseudomonadales bacterium]|nr:FKBP-type peptidyl-prolyl cis-trans isomerase [Pseudomonadales bacterium]
MKKEGAVMINFSLCLAGGEIIDSNYDQPAVKYVFGSGDMLEGFERQLLGMSVGEERHCVVVASDAFGEHREENLQKFKHSHFDKSIELRQGLVVSFTDAAGAELPGVVASIDEAYVEVDFNHPLAGKDIEFNVTIHEILD